VPPAGLCPARSGSLAEPAEVFRAVRKVTRPADRAGEVLHQVQAGAFARLAPLLLQRLADEG
jgi:hypothetical protein